MTIIIDGNNLLFRASFSIPAFENSEGLNIAAIQQTLKIMRSYAVGYSTKNVIATWDQKLEYDGSASFRKELHEDYKQNRNKNNDVYKTTPYIIDLLKFMGVPSMFPLRMEADDVISWLAQKVEGPITIITGDRDMLQLINERISVFNPYQKKTYTVHNFEQEMELPLAQFVLYKCILGDSSDNIKGLEKYGEKKSKKLAVSIGSFDNLSSLNAEQIEIIERNRKIMDLDLGWSLCDRERQSYEDQYVCIESIRSDPLKFKQFATKLEMTKLAENISYWVDPFQNSLNDVVSSWFTK